MSKRPTLIVVAHSARALAVSAARAGFAPLAIDMFGDCDTRAASEATIAFDGDFAQGFAESALMPAVESLIRDYDPIGLVYGSGFEHQPNVTESLSQRIRVIGNDAATVQRAKDPQTLAQLCEAIDVRYPESLAAPPKAFDGWLVKRQGGAGGTHVRPAKKDECAVDGRYFQRRVEGRAVSALFSADGRDANLIGFSVQWTSPTEGAPFRYGGAAGPVKIGSEAAAIIVRAIGGLTEKLGLRGLNSADFIVSEKDVHLVDLNPRPGASLDVFDRIDDPLVARHIAACEGRDAARAATPVIRAAEVVYAPEEIVARKTADWPDWIADRATPGTRIAAGDPLCTVLAEGADLESARSLVAGRARKAIAFLGGSSS